MEELATIVGDRVVGIARELTKAHEELVVQPISAILEQFTDPRGEFTILLPTAAPAVAPTESISVEALAAEVGHVTESLGISRREAMRQVGKRHGLAANEVYRRLERAGD
jgi:16S rRNA (cytidine1402-2'-O)-methyltransferase